MKSFIFYLVIFSLIPFFLFGKSSVPLKARDGIDIPEGEFLHYTIYKAGENYQQFYMVTKYLTDNIVKCYCHMYFEGISGPVPVNYTNYSWLGVVDLKKGSMIRFIQDMSEDYMVKNGKKGRYYLDLEVGSEVTTDMKFWDGYEIRETKSRLKNPDTGYPVWDSGGFVLWGARYLNWEEPGYAYLWTDVTKDLVKASLYKVKDNIPVKTPAGDFITTEVGFVISDPFLGSLLKQFTDSMWGYIEKGPKRRLVKMKSDIDNTEWVLDRSEIVR